MVEDVQRRIDVASLVAGLANTLQEALGRTVVLRVAFVDGPRDSDTYSCVSYAAEWAQGGEDGGGDLLSARSNVVVPAWASELIVW